MSLKYFVAPRIFDGADRHDDAAIAVEDGRVLSIVPQAELGQHADVTEFEGGMLVPGFVDLQTNGGNAILFNDDPTPEGLARICSAQHASGTTSLLPTLITDEPEITRAAIEAGIEAQRRAIPGFAGLHLEGPHLARERKGAHNPQYIRPMTAQDQTLLIKAKSELETLVVTLAPEAVDDRQIAELAGAGIVVSLGHSDASYERAQQAFRSGATMVTHLFNAMSQLGHREPGLVGAALENGIWAGIIADGIHVHPAALKLAMKAHTGPGQIFLVSDAMAQMGTSIESFELNGRMVQRKDGALRLADGTLAGADLTMIEAVRFLHQNLHVPFDQCLRMASLFPAQAIRRSDIGHLRKSARASFVHLDHDLRVLSTSLFDASGTLSRY